MIFETVMRLQIEHQHDERMDDFIDMNPVI